MARRIAYTGPAVLTDSEVLEQCRISSLDGQATLINAVIIPAVTAMAEAQTGAAVRQAEYEEDWPDTYPSGHALDIGQASAVLSVSVVGPDGALQQYTGAFWLQRGGRESYLHFKDGRPAGVLRIRYLAGVDLAMYPGIKQWMLMQAAAVWENRESMISGGAVAELPASFKDSLLSEITVPPRF